jgi:hypothetical protein
MESSSGSLADLRRGLRGLPTFPCRPVEKRTSVQRVKLPDPLNSKGLALDFSRGWRRLL